MSYAQTLEGQYAAVVRFLDEKNQEHADAVHGGKPNGWYKVVKTNGKPGERLGFYCHRCRMGAIQVKGDYFHCGRLEKQPSFEGFFGKLRKLRLPTYRIPVVWIRPTN